jgi:uncharacterized protein
MVKFESLRSDVLDRIPAAAGILERRSDVIFAFLFGGPANGQVNPLSDVDIAVYPSEGIGGPTARLTLFDELTNALETSELDLVVLNTAPTSLAGRILSSRRILVDRDPFFRQRYESLILREFFDFRPLSGTSNTYGGRRTSSSPSSTAGSARVKMLPRSVGW